MKKLIYILTGLISVCFALIIIAFVFLINLDLNEHKDWLAGKFNEATGRNLSINGDIENSFYPWLGIQVEGLEITNPPGFSDELFLQSELAAFRIKLLPLLSRNFQIDTLQLSGTTVNLEVDNRGNSNWTFGSDEEADASDSPAPDADTAPFNQLIIGGVRVEDLNISYDNRQSGQRIRAGDINLLIPELVYGDPLNINLAMALSSNQPALESDLTLSAVVTYDLDNNIYALENLVLDFLDSRLLASVRNSEDEVSASLEFSTQRSQEILALLGQAELAEQIQSIQLNLQAAGNPDQVDISALELALQLTDATLSRPSRVNLQARGAVNLAQENLRIDSFTLDAMDLNASGQLTVEDYNEDARLSGEFSLAEFSPKRLAALLAIELPPSRDNTVLESVALSTAFTASSDSAALDNLRLSLDDTEIDGELGISNFNNPAYRFTLNLSGIDLDRYMAPETNQTAATTSDEDSELPLDAIRALNLDGSLNIASLQVSGLNLNNVVVRVNAARGLINLNPIQASLYQGNYNGSLSLDARGEQPAFSLQSGLQGINLQNIANDFMGASYVSGLGNLNLSLSGAGLSTRDILGSLDGSADLALSDGSLSGVDVGSVLTQLETMIASRRLQAVNLGQQTRFQDLSASINIADGIARTQNLFIQSSGFNIRGNGTLANLRDNNLNFNLLASVDQASASVQDQQFDIGGYTLPISCTGSMDAPRCLPNVENIFQQAVGSLIQEEVGGLLQRVLGNEAEGTETNAEDDPGNAQEQPAPEQQLINRALESLFR